MSAEKIDGIPPHIQDLLELADKYMVAARKRGVTGAKMSPVTAIRHALMHVLENDTDGPLRPLMDASLEVSMAVDQAISMAASAGYAVATKEAAITIGNLNTIARLEASSRHADRKQAENN